MDEMADMYLDQLLDEDAAQFDALGSSIVFPSHSPPVVPVRCPHCQVEDCSADGTAWRLLRMFRVSSLQKVQNSFSGSG